MKASAFMTWGQHKEKRIQLGINNSSERALFGVLGKPAPRAFLSFFLATIGLVFLCPGATAFATVNPPTILSPVFSSQDTTPTIDGKSGALTESIPLDIPPGRSGLQPDLSLDYDSQDTDQDSIVGFGWTLSIPYIERENKTGSENLYDTSPYFTSSLDGELTVAVASDTIDVLVVGGGGGGSSGSGAAGGGGGGGGGVVASTTYYVGTQTYTVTIGAGGAAGSNGATSTFGTLNATGGGAGGGPGVSGNFGGSGGGGGCAGGGADGATDQGSAGGNGYSGSSCAGGGGGGAGGVGANSPATNIGGNGGGGIYNDISGVGVFYGGGGGGSGGFGAGDSGGSGSLGGGADGGAYSNASSGTPNTGGGGGGTNANYVAGTGGSGIVVISYPTQSAPNFTCGGTLSTSGADTICTYASSGSFTSKATSTPAIATNVYAARVDDGSFRQYTYSTSTDSWTMYDKKGDEYLFGASSQSKQSATTSQTDTVQTYKWMLEKEIDPNGNYLRYVYSKDHNQLYPTEIVYTGHNSTDGPMTISFATSSRPDTTINLLPGFEVDTDYRISQITAAVAGSTVRQYNLSYTTGNNGYRSLLSALQESGWNQGGVETTLPPWTFAYISSSTPFVTSGWGSSNCSSGSSYAAAEVLGDGANRSVTLNYDGFSDDMRILNDPSSPISWPGTSTYFGYKGCPGETGTRLVDVSGDGMADVVQNIYNYSTGLSTSLNYFANSGGSWSATTSYNGVIPQFDISGSVGGSTGIFGDVDGTGLPAYEQNMTISGYSIGNGAYLPNGSAWNAATTTVFSPPESFPSSGPDCTDSQLVDLTGDGLDDWVYTDGSKTYALLNTGTGWETDPRWTLSTSTVYESGGNCYDRGWRFVDVNGDGLPDLIRSYSNSGNTVMEPGTYQVVYLNTGHGWATSTAYSLPYIVSPNNQFGNGESDTELANFYGNGQQDQDVLATTTNPKGAITSITYAYSAQSGSNPKLPYNLLVVAKSVTNDGRGNLQETDYTYSGGLQYLPLNVYDRKFAGFASVTASTSVASSTTYYSQGSTTTAPIAGDQNDGYGQLNHPYREDIATPSGTLVRTTFYQYGSTWHGSSEFVGLMRQLEQDYASDGSHLDKDTDYVYSPANDDLIDTLNYGQVTGNSNGTFSTSSATSLRTTVISYAASSSINLSVPKEKTLTNASSSTSTDAKYFYDNLSFGSVNLGNQTQEQDWISGSSYASSTETYNSYGLVGTSTDRDDHETVYGYDSYDLYPATTTNALGQSTTYQYNYSNGKVATSTDPNGSVTKNTYDGIGRLTETDESNPSSPSTLIEKSSFTYTDSTTTPSLVHESDYLNSASTTDTYDYYDGLDRLIQERKSTGTSGTYSVTDDIYNSAGLLASQSLPYFSSGSGNTTATTTESLFTANTYDPLQRPLTAANAVGTTTNVYAKWTTTTTDPLGNVIEYILDAYNNLAQVIELGGTATTTYSYDAANDLTKLTDASGNIRDFTYDGLGDLLTSEDLHTPAATQFGTSTYAYDAAGNLTSQTDPKGQTINRTYDALNRVLTEALGTTTENTYTYDSCTYGIGHICTASSTSAKISSSYDILGRVSSATTTIDANTYTIAYQYDRQGNPTQITYPDGSTVAYAYNAAELPSSVTHAPAGGSFSNIISAFSYASMGLPSLKVFGNGASTTYAYNANALYELTQLATFSTSTSATSSPISPNPNGYWKFDESSGAASDATGDGNALTNNNTVTYSAGKINNAANFVAASNQSFSIANSSQVGLNPTGSFSTSAWFKLTTEPGGNEYAVVRKGNVSSSEGSFSVELGVEPNGVYVIYTDNGSTAADAHVQEWDSAANVLPTTGSWHLLTVDVSPGTPSVTVTIDGSPITMTERAGDGPISSIYNGTDPFYVGGANTTGRYFNGSLDEVGFWKGYLLTSTDIANLYNSGNGLQLNFGGVASATYLQNLNYEYDNDLNIKSITDLSDTLAQSATSYVYDTLNRLTGADTTSASTSPFSYVYSYDPLGNITSGGAEGGATASTTAPTSYWKFDETSGSASDSGGSGNTLTNNNTITYSSGEINNAANLVAANDQYFSIASGSWTGLDPTTSFSLFFWLKLASLPGSNEYSIITKGNSAATNDDYRVMIGGGTNNNEIYVLWSDNGSFASGEGDLGEYDGPAGYFTSGDIGQWVPIAIVVDAANQTVTAYKNGVATTLTKRSGSNASTISQSAVEFDVGREGTSRFLDGSIDEMRFWKNYKLTSSEVTSLDTVNSVSGTVYQYGGTGFPNPDAVTVIGNGMASTTFAYDRDGNLIQSIAGATTTLYTWDWAGRLVRTDVGASGATTTTTYGYDTTGNRVFQQTGSTTTVYPNPYESIVSTVVGSTTYATSTDYIDAPQKNGQSLPVAEVFQRLVNASATGTPTTDYALTDNLGSVVGLLNASGTLDSLQDFYPYGATRVASSTGSFASSKGYIGQFSDASGLSYLNARYYNGAQGQFLSQDPIFLGDPSGQDLQDPQSLNAYSYSEDNPIIGSDPTGKNVYLYARGVSQTFGLADHLGYYISPNPGSQFANVGDFSLNGEPQNGPIPPWGNLVSEVGYAANGTATPLPSNQNMYVQLTPAKGQTEDEMIKELLKGSGAVNSVGLSYWPSGNISGWNNGNSNNSAYTLAQFAGISAQFQSFSSQFNAPGDNVSVPNIVAAHNASLGSGGVSSGGSSLPNANSWWTTPSGAVVTWSGSLVAASAPSQSK